MRGLARLLLRPLTRHFASSPRTASSGSDPVSGLVWGPLKRRGDKEWVSEQAASKRGRKLITQLVTEEKVRAVQNESWRDLAHVRSGDAVAVRYLYSSSQTKENVFRGICVGTKRNGLASGLWVMNMVSGQEVTGFFKAFSPHVKGVDVVKKGMVKANRNKITHLRGKLRSFIKARGL